MSGSANERYSRQILFSPIGAPGQLRLSQSVVAIVGCGATGSAVAALLARAGVGRLRLIDRDYVEASNLQRQSLFDEDDARESLPKALAAARKIAQFNSAINVQPEVADLVPENAAALLGDCHLILDGTDNFETRYLINDLAVSRDVPRMARSDSTTSRRTIWAASCMLTGAAGSSRPAPARPRRRAAAARAPTGPAP